MNYHFHSTSVSRASICSESGAAEKNIESQILSDMSRIVDKAEGSFWLAGVMPVEEALQLFLGRHEVDL